MAKKYKGFKGSGYNQAKIPHSTKHLKKLGKFMSRAILSKLGINGKY